MTAEAGSSADIYFMASENGGATFSYYIATMAPGVYDGAGFRAALDNVLVAS